MEFKEMQKEKVFYNDLPNEIKKSFNHIYYSKYKKSLFINKNKDCKIEITNIKKMYYDDDDIFMIKSSIYTIIFWVDIRKWHLIKSV